MRWLLYTVGLDVNQTCQVGFETGHQLSAVAGACETGMCSLHLQYANHFAECKVPYLPWALPFPLLPQSFLPCRGSSWSASRQNGSTGECRFLL